MNVHLISFGAPFHIFSRAHYRVLQNAKDFGQCSSVNLFSENNIFDFCPEIIPYKNFLSSTRGYGYWMWKSFLISRIMELVPDDDLICYADIGCTLNNGGVKRFKEYCNLTSEHGSLCFKKIFPKTLDHLNTGQRCATTFFLKNTHDNKNIIQEIKNISIENDHFYINDSLSHELNHEEFKDHRHDQSIFSLMSKKYKFYCIPDETYWAPDWNHSGKHYPIWATRNKF